MGFTIGGMREIRELRQAARRPRRSGRVPLPLAVAEYTGLWGWDVTPGALSGHPLDPGLTIAAGTSLDGAARAWARTPGAAVLLPTGRSFDVLEVPAAAGRRALPRLERLGLPLGPVAGAPGGPFWFLVAPGAAVGLPRLLGRTGWDEAVPGLRALGPGAHITAPPSELAGRGRVRWLRPPDLETAAAPVRARPLLGALAYACRRSPCREW